MGKCGDFCDEWGRNMPEINLFFGIRITIYYKDHNPPHIHAEYADNKAAIDIQDACVLYQDELMQNWELVKSGKSPNPVPPMGRM